MEEGNLPTLSHGLVRERDRGTFAPGGSAHAHTQSSSRPSSAQPTMDSGRRFARGVTMNGDLRCSTAWQACTVQETASMVWCGSLPALTRKGEGYRTPRATKEAHGKRRPTHRHGLFQIEGPHAAGGRGSDARGRARASLMLLQKSTDIVRRREADALHLTRFGKRSGTGA
jgi:hypothetical protein